MQKLNQGTINGKEEYDSAFAKKEKKPWGVCVILHFLSSRTTFFFRFDS